VISERLKASSPFLILCLLLIWLGGELMRVSSLSARKDHFLHEASALLLEAGTLRDQWKSLNRSFRKEKRADKREILQLDRTLTQTTGWIRRVSELGNRFSAGTPSRSPLTARVERLRSLAREATVRIQPALLVPEIQGLTEDLGKTSRNLLNMFQSRSRGFPGTRAPSGMLVFLATLTSVLVVLGLERFFAGRIRENLILLRETLIRLNQNRIHLDAGPGLDLKNRLATLYPLPKIAFLLNGFLERHKEVLHKIRVSAENCEQAVGLIRNSHREILEGTRVQAGAADETAASTFQMSATLNEIASNVQDISRAAEGSFSSIQEMDRSMHQITGGSEELFSLVENASSSIQEMVISLGQIRENLTSLTQSVEDTTASVSEINASTREVSQIAKESAALSQKSTLETSEQGVKAVQKTIEGMHKIDEAVNHADRLIQVLNSRSGEIGEILNVISEIAEKTNLLALNAAIIASQAGEHGKGFSVVATEIKALAERTASSIDQIETVISNIQSETRMVSQSIHQSVEQVRKGVTLSKETKQALRQILDQSRKAGELSWKIESSAIEQVKSIARVNEEIQKINETVHQIAAAVSEQDKGGMVIHEMVEKLTFFSENLKQSMQTESEESRKITGEINKSAQKFQQINRAIQEQRIGSEQIVRAIERIQTITGENQRLTHDLNTAIASLALYNHVLQEEVSKSFTTADENILTLGIVPLEAPEKMKIRFTPLARFLEKALGRKVVIRASDDFESAVRDLGTGKSDLAYLTPSTFLEGKDKYGIRVVLKEVRGHKPFYHSVIAAKEGSGIHSVSQLRGRRFAFGDRKSTSSFLMPRAMLASAGLSMDDLEEARFLGHHDAVAWAIVQGEVDAGGLLESVACSFIHKGLKILETSVDIPGFNFCIRPGLDTGLCEEITRAIIGLDENNPEHAQVLNSIEDGCNGFTQADYQDYAGIQEMMENLSEA